MKKRVTMIISFLIVSMFLVSTAFAAQPIAKNIKAYFRGIKIKANNKILNQNGKEPFLYKSTVYVPIRMVSEALGKSVHWDPNQNMVIITGSDEDINKMRTLQNRNNFLEFRVAELEKALLDEDNDKDKDDYDVDDFEDWLYDEYDEWRDIKFDFKVKERSKNKIKLTIEFDKYKYKDEWEDLSERKVERWLEDIYDHVKDEFSDKFEGTIEDTDRRETLVEFYDSRDKLKVKFKDSKDSSSSDLEYDLEDKYGRDLDSYSKRFGRMKADFDVDVDEDYEEINIDIEIDTDRYGDEWDDVRDTSSAEDWITDIVDYSQKEYKRYRVYGKIKNERGRTIAEFKATSSGNMTFDW